MITRFTATALEESKQPQTSRRRLRAHKKSQREALKKKVKLLSRRKRRQKRCSRITLRR